MSRYRGNIDDESSADDVEAAGPHPDWLPSWLRSVQLAIWAVNENQEITYIGPAAAKLFKRHPDACIGLPCHQVVSGHDRDGAPICCEGCPKFSAALNHEHVDAFDLYVGPANNRRCLRIYVGVAATRPDGGFELVHLAEDLSRERQIESYVERLSLRSPKREAREPSARVSPREVLSARELEVLSLLAKDATLEEVASALCISYSTVRNHVQHVLDKTGAHSTLEAVARYLMQKTPDRPA